MGDVVLEYGVCCKGKLFLDIVDGVEGFFGKFIWFLGCLIDNNVGGLDFGVYGWDFELGW